MSQDQQAKPKLNFKKYPWTQPTTSLPTVITGPNPSSHTENVEHNMGNWGTSTSRMQPSVDDTWGSVQETPNDLEVPYPPTVNLISSPEPTPSLYVSLSSPIHPPYEELLEVDVPGEDPLKDLTQMSEKVKGKMKAGTLDVDPTMVDPLPTTLMFLMYLLHHHF
ncbi:hypothetical protein BU17DRAFT_82576 [Hysterangium stoloniferum]|nr:hypothetical protein BU17DRAFT_82576 [Hysterangium stoloniferum]